MIATVRKKLIENQPLAERDMRLAACIAEGDEFVVSGRHVVAMSFGIPLMSSANSLIFTTYMAHSLEKMIASDVLSPNLLRDGASLIIAPRVLPISDLLSVSISNCYQLLHDLVIDRSRLYRYAELSEDALGGGFVLPCAILIPRGASGIIPQRILRSAQSSGERAGKIIQGLWRLDAGAAAQCTPTVTGLEISPLRKAIHASAVNTSYVLGIHLARGLIEHFDGEAFSVQIARTPTHFCVKGYNDDNDDFHVDLELPEIYDSNLKQGVISILEHANSTFDETCTESAGQPPHHLTK